MKYGLLMHTAKSRGFIPGYFYALNKIKIKRIKKLNFYNRDSYYNGIKLFNTPTKLRFSPIAFTV